MLSALFLFGFIFWVQELPLDGNMGGMLAVLPLFAAAVAALGLWVGSFFDHAERAMLILGPTTVPFFFLTGTAWPLNQMPRVVQALAMLVPSTAGVHSFVPLNQMHAALADVIGDATNLALLALGYGALAGYRLIERGRPDARAKADGVQPA